MNQQTSAQQEPKMDNTQALDSNETELTEQQELKYLKFCEKHDLDGMMDAQDQLYMLQAYGHKALASALRGILTPQASSVTLKKNLCVSVMEAIIADEVAQAAHDAQIAASKQATVVQIPVNTQVTEAICVLTNTETTPSIALWCASQPVGSMKNSSRTKSGQIQLGLAL